MSSPVHSVRTLESGKVLLTTVNGKSEEYDHVIMACHADASLAILRAGGGVTDEEESILGGFQWNKNVAVIHSDTKLMPKNTNAWSSWNYLAQSYMDDMGVHRAHYDAVSCTYWLNYIQNLPVEKHGQIFLTLNPPFEPDSNLVFREFVYDHPVLDANAVSLQRRIRTIQNTRGISYAGAWLSYGFHEDGFTSGLRAVTNAIPNVHPPFEIADPDREPHESLTACVFDWLEESGWRVYLGALLATCLGWIAWLFGVKVGGGISGKGDLKRVTGKARA
jgi:predicted NAD/FAD-binding protein